MKFKQRSFENSIGIFAYLMLICCGYGYQIIVSNVSASVVHSAESCPSC